MKSWGDYPLSAVLEGISAAFSGAIGFIVAIVVGILIGFAGHGVTVVDTHDGFFMLYLFTFFPLGLLQHLLNASGVLTALGVIVVTALFFTSDRFKAESMLGLCLCIGLYTFQAIGLTDETRSNAWPRFAVIALSLLVFFVGVRVLAGLGRNRETKRKANQAPHATSEPAPNAASSAREG